MANYFLSDHEMVLIIMLVKYRRGNQLQLVFPVVFVAIKAQLCCSDSAITAHSVVWQPFSDLKKTSNTFPLSKILL